jgi:rSAM/selenodomain-associated transferase 2
MISVIIPTLNEAAYIGKCIEAIRREDDRIEIIVADGGSIDNTKEIAAGYKKVINVDSEKGRGLQMNMGAAASSCDMLLFLHADTTIESGWSQSILSALDDPSVIGGAFTFAVNDHSWKYRLVEAWVKMRCNLFNLPYGDQAVFIKKSTFEMISGYRNIPLMEDVDLIDRMKKAGRISILDKKAFTSERRWKKKGLIKTAAINQITMLLYKLGVSHDRLSRFYYR